jgi:hypothetical protein
MSLRIGGSDRRSRVKCRVTAGRTVSYEDGETISFVFDGWDQRSYVLVGTQKYADKVKVSGWSQSGDRGTKVAPFPG